jgi:hypothetical protein
MAREGEERHRGDENDRARQKLREREAERQLDDVQRWIHDGGRLFGGALEEFRDRLIEDEDREQGENGSRQSGDQQRTV